MNRDGAAEDCAVQHQPATVAAECEQRATSERRLQLLVGRMYASLDIFRLTILPVRMHSGISRGIAWKSRSRCEWPLTLQEGGYRDQGWAGM